jgi:DNA primase
MDVVALAQHGVENAVATLGTATTPNHVSKLLKLADNVVFCFDGDAAGRKAAWRALEVSLPVLADGKVVSFLFLPSDDDPDDFVRREGKDAFLAAVASAKPLSQFLFSELASHVDMATEEGRARFVSQAKPLLEGVTAPALSAMLRRRMAEMAQLDALEVERLVPHRAAQAAPAGAPRRSAPARAVRRPMKSAEAQLLGRLLARPELALQVPDEILGGQGATGAALAEAVAFFRAHPDATLGRASAHFEGTEHQAAIAEALNEPLLNQAESPDFDLVAEGRELIERMLAEKRERRSAELLPRVAGGTATPEEKAEYEALIRRLSRAKLGNAGPEERSKL